MAVRASKRRSRRSQTGDNPSDLEVDAFLDEEGFRWLNVPNIIGVAVAEKQQRGKATGKLAVVFDVLVKLGFEGDIAKAGSRRIPESIEVGGRRLPTDVVEAWPEAHQGISPEHTTQHNPVIGGISVGTAQETGTLGAVLWDRNRRRPVALSNWHVLATRDLEAVIYQPGPGNANGSSPAVLGRLAAPGIINRKVDAAVATIDFRTVDDGILGLGTGVHEVARPQRGQRVVKSGAVTGTTFGVVTNPRKLVSLALPGLSANHNIAVCVIEADPSASSSERICGAGDSGACWILVDDAGIATGTMIGLHVGGDGPTKAYACHAEEVFAALGLEPLPYATPAADFEEPEISERLLATSPRSLAPQVARRVIARDGLLIRGGPSPEFPTIGKRLYGELVHVLASHGDWQMIDVRGDGKSDGFVHTAFLQDI